MMMKRHVVMLLVPKTRVRWVVMNLLDHLDGGGSASSLKFLCRVGCVESKLGEAGLKNLPRAHRVLNPFLCWERMKEDR